MFQVIIPEWEYYYVRSKKTATKYWLFKDFGKMPLRNKTKASNLPLLVNKLLYCIDNEGNRFIKNPIKAGKENIWVLNGQDLYNAKLDWRQRSNVAKYYHEYFGKYIEEQLEPIILPENTYFSISVDIYEIMRGNMPDASNMWLLEKFFEDALQEKNIISDDDYRNVIESGRKRYHWVSQPSERKLVFNIDFITI